MTGRNRITVRGKLAEGSALRVTYVWDDPQGKARRNVTVAETLPHAYEIIAAGAKWADVFWTWLMQERRGIDSPWELRPASPDEHRRTTGAAPVASRAR